MHRKLNWQIPEFITKGGSTDKPEAGAVRKVKEAGRGPFQSCLPLLCCSGIGLGRCI